MNRPRLAIHAHFYQPERRDPFSGRVPAQANAAPYHDWNSRIDAECYRPNAERGNLRRISYDLGPTLAAWLAENDRATHDRFVASDLSGAAAPDTGAAPATAVAPGTGAAPATAVASASEPRNPATGNAIAGAYHHSILPLASLADRRTEIAWGLRDFELRFGRRATGMWLPETAVDLPTLRIVADAGVRYTILAPWQAAAPLDTRRPYRVDLGDGRAIAVVFYDGALSAAASFDPAATADADVFARDMAGRSLAGPAFADGTAALAVIATDGEMYGHHLKFRDLFLSSLVDPGPEAPRRNFDIVTLGEALGDAPAASLPATGILERTSWSCHHGLLRWTAECPDVPDGRWKGPLRAALDRLAAGIDAVTAGSVRDLLSPDAFTKARDAYVDVLFGATEPREMAARTLPDAHRRGHQVLLEMLEAQRWRLAMFASDGWFWEDPVRRETKHILLCAARAVRIVDGRAGTALEARLVEDLALLTSPSRGIDGAAIYAEALEEAGQPRP